MKSIVVGFADERGQTNPKVICGPEVPDAGQYKIIAAAKRDNKYPKGVKRLEYMFLESQEVAIAVATSTNETE